MRVVLGFMVMEGSMAEEERGMEVFQQDNAYNVTFEIKKEGHTLANALRFMLNKE